ncbi:hypothetical protein HOLleu_43526 [Holothuria leucospilota]|uniref:SWIM-type domain-containing protein n=1 Tax=Holothuria leucospilota TaxID=206669 RepID=A0A9Q1BB09_HOLLE|nr:hypothetical protein HOLleu_43526 [Holothuria leucospilota]
MCKNFQKFCISTPVTYPMSVDPTFEFGKFEVTPFTYRHAFLVHQRSKVPPVFMGPTAIHHGKDKATYSRIMSSVTRSCPNLKTGTLGFITDGESALYKALAEEMPNATGLRCFRHFLTNCRQKLNSIGIKSRRDHKFFLDAVFGCSDVGGLVDSEDSVELRSRIDKIKDGMNERERFLLKEKENYESKFWKYIKKNERTMSENMVKSKRREAGMPDDGTGTPRRSYTNQSESLNNILTRQQEAVERVHKKKSSSTKLRFVKDVWEAVINHQTTETQRAICGLSNEYKLSEAASYLQINQDEWFSWDTVRREEYVDNFNNLTIEDVLKKKTIKSKPIPSQIRPSCNPHDDLFPSDLKDFLRISAGLSTDVAEILIKETEFLLSSPTAVREMPTLGIEARKKFCVASQTCKRGYYVCSVFSDHVWCDCQCFKYQKLCKHSLCIAAMQSILKTHIEFVSKRKKATHKSSLLPPIKDAAGKKGGQHKNAWRPRHQQLVTNKDNASNLVVQDRPFTEIHHNNYPLVVCFLADEPKALHCHQCKIEFPRCQLIRPYDIVLSHKERWQYRTKEDPLTPRTSSKFTTKFYCVMASCVLRRFHYFTSSFLEVPKDVKTRLHDSHLSLLNRELNYPGK